MTNLVKDKPATTPEQHSPLDFQRPFPPDLSHDSLIQGDGYYVIGGPSPYEIEFQRPKRDLLARKQGNETLMDAIRRQPLTEDELRYVALYGLHSAVIAAPAESQEGQPSKSIGGWFRTAFGLHGQRHSNGDASAVKERFADRHGDVTVVPLPTLAGAEPSEPSDRAE